MDNSEKILVVGAGNTLMGDDGAGIRVIELLERDPDFQTELYNCGTDIFQLGILDVQYDDIILVDAVRTGLSPGTIHWFTQEQLLSFSRSQSAHQISLLESLALLPIMNPLFNSSRFSIIGIEPVSVSREPGLSRLVQESVSYIADYLTQPNGRQDAIDRCQSSIITSVIPEYSM